MKNFFPIANDCSIPADLIRDEMKDDVSSEIRVRFSTLCMFQISSVIVDVYIMKVGTFIMKSLLLFWNFSFPTPDF